jgi:ABC-type bacteriocin/lantibiotic exporter with double-glycine peptidase domain
MSPASYLTAPPRVATPRIASVFMPWWTWIALAFFLLAVVIGAAVTFLSLRQMRRLQATGAEVAAALEELTRKTEELERRLEHASECAEMVEKRLDLLNESLERLSVLTWALDDVGKTISQLRSAILLKK